MDIIRPVLSFKGRQQDRLVVGISALYWPFPPSHIDLHNADKTPFRCACANDRTLS